MAKSTFFTGQPVFAQLCKYLDRDEILRISTESGGERYRKSFDAWTHLLSMLYAVVMRFDSLREIEAPALTFVNRMPHLQMSCVPKQSTLGDANAKRSESIFGDIYFSLLGAHRHRLLPDSRPIGQPGWLGRLKIIDSTTVPLFSNLVFRGVGRDPKLGKKKGGIKVHTVISANEGVPGDIRFTSAATHDSFMLKPADFDDGDVLAMDRAYIDYEKLEALTLRGVTYVTKMKRGLTYETVSESVLLDDDKYRNRSVKEVIFRKGETTHKARIISYTETKTSRKGSKEQEVQLLTNSFDLGVDEVIAIYLRRWQIESLFNIFIQGTDANFSGTKNYLLSHDINTLYDIHSLKKSQDIDNKYRNFRSFEAGITDKTILDISKHILDTLSPKEHFSLTIATIETHYPYGFYNKKCEDKPKDFTEEASLIATIQCASKSVRSFITWVKKQPFYPNTEIIILGDHLFGGNYLVDKNVKERRWYNLFINPVKIPANLKKEFTSVDIAPTILESLGFTIENHKMGFGVSLFSNESTLVEKIGIDSLNNKFSAMRNSLEYNWPSAPAIKNK